MPKGKRPAKVSPFLVKRLIAAHLQGGLAVSRPMCRKLGLDDRYAQRKAYEIGRYFKRRGFKQKTYKDLPTFNTLHTYDDWDDPRWQWAIDRGPVII